MNNQLVESNVKTQNNILIAIMIILIIVGMVLGFYLSRENDPYLEAVLSLPGDKTRGEAIFQVNCAGCHGSHGNGNIGPTLQDISEHKSKRSLIEQVVSGKTPPMPKFQPSSQDMADLLSYLQNL